MKTIILILSLLAAGSTVTFAQCNKDIFLTSSKTDHLDESGTVKRTAEEAVKINIGKSDLVIIISDDHTLKGKIKSETCDWSVPFKTGKTVIKTTISDENGGDDKEVTITIEGKDGKVTLIFAVDGDSSDIIRITPDKFEEKA